MTASQILLLIFYLFLIGFNYEMYKKDKSLRIITFVTAALSTFLLCGSNVADLDLSVTELDVSGYRMIYENQDALENEEFNMYYLFYGSMFIGQKMGLSYRMWWTLMSIMAMLVIFCSCKIHKYNYNLFLATFMAYYELIFYSGLKFFYGFCFLLLAYGFLLRNNYRGKILFALFTLAAGGFHMLYYFFLLFLLKPIKNSGIIVKPLVVATLFFTIVMRFSNSAFSYMAPFFYAMENEHIMGYTAVTVRSGFFVAVFLHFLVVYIAYQVRYYNMRQGTHSVAVDVIFYTTLLSILAFPFYAIALTFMRFITAFSLVVITACSVVLSDTEESRTVCTKYSILLVVAFLLAKLVTGYGATRGFFEVSVKPFFDVM